jgi:hypothetical protein
MSVTSKDSGNDLEGLFQRELQAINEDVRRKAAVSTLNNLRLNNRVTVEQFVSSISRHKDVWAVVSSMGILDLAAALSGQGTAPRAPEKSGGEKTRTRLSDEQKAGLKGVALRQLESHRAGLSRTELAAVIRDEQLKPAGIADEELADKLRIPLAELVTENKIHTVGEKRLMKYVPGVAKKK